MSKKLDTFNKKQLKQDFPEIRPGYTIKVHQKIKEGEKQRIQVFEGLVIARKHGKGINATITVRKVTSGIGVERIFPIHAPFIEKIEVVKKGKVRRAKLYYIRHKSAKGSRLKEIKENNNKESQKTETKKDEEPIEEKLEKKE